MLTRFVSDLDTRAAHAAGVGMPMFRHSVVPGRRERGKQRRGFARGWGARPRREEEQRRWRGGVEEWLRSDGGVVVVGR